MKIHTFLLILSILILSCNLPVSFPPSPTQPVVASQKEDILSGEWRGEMRNVNDNQTYEMTLSIQPNEKGFTGSLNFGNASVILETYEISGAQINSAFEFTESSGRYFWGTLENRTLIGFIAWDCFHCRHWGEFTLTPQTDPQPAASSQADSSSSSLIRFESVADGGTISGSVDPLTGLPTATIRVQVERLGKFIYLDADGLYTGYYHDDAQLSASVDLQWTPWHGNGVYRLDVYLANPTAMSAETISQQTITINVTGIPEGTPTLHKRFAQLFQERYGFYAPYPAVTRFIRPFPDAFDASRWSGAIYYQGYVYEINIMDTGEITQFYAYTNYDNNYSYCKPSGIIKMLAVVVDYGNTGIDPNAAADGLYAGLATANARWAGYSHSIGLSEPILQAELITAVAGAPVVPGQYLTVDEVLAKTGYDPRQFDVLVEVDLDRDNLATGQYGGLGVSLSGGCMPSGSQSVNIGMNISEAPTPEYLSGTSIFEHELIHAMGWQHWWANGDGGAPDWMEMGGYWMPYLMFGWTDTDGDGIIEIQDPTPYGIQ